MRFAHIPIKRNFEPQRYIKNFNKPPPSPKKLISPPQSPANKSNQTNQTNHRLISQIRLIRPIRPIRPIGLSPISPIGHKKSESVTIRLGGV